MSSSKTNPIRKHHSFTIKDFHKEHKKMELENGVPREDIISYKKYQAVIMDFFCEIFKKIIYEQFTFMMPYSLGTITVKAVKCSPKNLAIDFHRTKKLGKVVRHLNTHSFGYYFMVAWEKNYVRFRNNAFYSFVPTSSKRATDLGIGKVALARHIKRVSKDPTQRSFVRI